MKENQNIKLIKVDNISKSFGNNIIFENVSFEIFTGEVFGILGVSGSGKTTILEILCGLINSDSGQILNFFKKDKPQESIMHFNKHMKKFVSMSLQEPAFYEELTVYENLKYFAKLFDVKNKEIESLIEKNLKMVRLYKTRNLFSKNLSSGMKKRLDLAIALTSSPKVLILDEPTDSLDYNLRFEILDIIIQLKEMGIAIIFVSHIIEELELVCDKIGLLENKKLKVFKNNKTVFKEFLEKRIQK